MSSISALSGGIQQAMASASAAQTMATKAAATLVKDSDGDHDGTAPGQTDPRDAGKGMSVDTRA